jgi:hypothetical protein
MRDRNMSNNGNKTRLVYQRKPVLVFSIAPKTPVHRGNLPIRDFVKSQTRSLRGCWLFPLAAQNIPIDVKRKDRPRAETPRVLILPLTVPGTTHMK